MAQATANLKRYSEWTEESDLGDVRASFFFRPALSEHKNTVVFVTNILFYGDIIESKRISSYLHGPVVLMPRSLAHFVFKEYSIHLHLDWSKVQSQNEKFMNIGSVFIADGFDVNIENAIKNVISVDFTKQNIVELMNNESHVLQKAAMTEIEDEVFSIEKQDRFLKANMVVQDKFDKDNGIITEVEPGDTGFVFIRKGNNHQISVSKNEFDHYFVVAS